MVRAGRRPFSKHKGGSRRLHRISGVSLLAAAIIALVHPGIITAASAHPVDNGWGAPTSIGTSLPEEWLHTPTLAMNSRGEAVAVWYARQFDTETRSAHNYSVRANLYHPATGWRGEQTVAVFTDFPLIDDPVIEVHMDEAGNVLVAWGHGLYQNRSVWVLSYDASAAAWGDPFPLDSEPGYAWPPKITMGPQGIAIVAWSRDVGPDIHAMASRYVHGEGWGAPTRIGPGLEMAVVSDVAVDPDGNGLVAVVDLNTDRAYAIHYADGEGWGPAVPIDSGEGLVSGYWGPSLQVELDGGGNAIAVWSEVNRSHWLLWDVSYNNFSPSTGWGSASTLAEHVRGHKLVLAEDGSAFVLLKVIAENTERFFAKRFHPTTGWESSAPIDAAPRAAINNVGIAADIGMDNHGNALVMWAEEPGDGTYAILTRQYSPGMGWGLAIESPHVRYLGDLETDSEGNAIVAWGELCWGCDVFASRFPQSVPAPSLAITSPATGVTNISHVVIAGRTDRGAVVTVNARPVPVDVGGFFGLNVTLPDGIHSFAIKAQNAAGLTSSVVITVTVDTIAPVLHFSTPLPDSVTETAKVTVTGTTEPGAYLVVNGFVVAVAKDGSFAVDAHLSPGANIFRASSTDVAGNSATASLSVHYRPILAPSFLGIGAQIWLIVALVASLAGLVLYQGASRFLQRPRVSRPDGPGAVIPTEAARPWPKVPSSHPLHLITRERILVHLLEFARESGRREVPQQFTQQSVADAVGVTPRHLSQYIRPLVDSGLAEKKTERVQGGLQRRKVLMLTERGQDRASEIRSRVQAVAVPVRTPSGVRRVPIAEVLRMASEQRSLLALIREVVEEGVVALAGQSQ